MLSQNLNTLEVVICFTLNGSVTFTTRNERVRLQKEFGGEGAFAKMNKPQKISEREEFPVLQVTFSVVNT